MAFSLSFDELPKIEKVKSFLEHIADLGDRIGAPIRDLDVKLAEQMSEISYSIFCYQKQKRKTFTVCGNDILKKMRIAEDADGFSEADSFFLMDFFKNDLNNLEAFAELVAESYVLPQPKKGLATERLFCASVYSCYVSEKHPVFFSNRDGEFYIFEDKLTDIKLSDYIADYFSASELPEIKGLAERVLLPGESFANIQRTISQVFEKFFRNSLNKYDFISGAITFLDFLAWKGLWQSQNGNRTLERVSELIDKFRQELDDLSQELFLQAKGIPLSKLISISDTIAVFTPKVSAVTECQLLELHAKLSRLILERCSQEKLPIRGAIAFGEYSIKNNIMIGPGIDECASWHETGNWIGVHFTPTAHIFWYDCVNPNEDVICGYNVPLKNGLIAEYCVKWSISKDTFNEMALNAKALLPEIAAKYTNTYRFIKEKVWKEEDSNGKK